MLKDEAQVLISNTIDEVNKNPLIVRENNCVACHVLFKMAKEMKLNEQDASNLLSEVLYSNPILNDSFIEMVENIHMKRRMMGTNFVIKKREAKDRYLSSNFKNTLAELHADMINHGAENILRRLVLSEISLEIAKNIGIDYHASTEELYYYMRKNDQETSKLISDFINQLYQRIFDRKL